MHRILRQTGTKALTSVLDTDTRYARSVLVSLQFRLPTSLLCFDMGRACGKSRRSSLCLSIFSAPSFRPHWWSNNGSCCQLCLIGQSSNGCKLGNNSSAQTSINLNALKLNKHRYGRRRKLKNIDKAACEELTLRLARLNPDHDPGSWRQQPFAEVFFFYGGGRGVFFLRGGA